MRLFTAELSINITNIRFCCELKNCNWQKLLQYSQRRSENQFPKCSALWKLVTAKHFKLLSQKAQDFFSKFDQIRSFVWIWSHLLKKSLMENFIFWAVALSKILFRILTHLIHAFSENNLFQFTFCCKVV